MSEQVAKSATIDQPYQETPSSIESPRPQRLTPVSKALLERDFLVTVSTIPMTQGKIGPELEDVTPLAAAPWTSDKKRKKKEKKRGDDQKDRSPF